MPESVTTTPKQQKSIEALVLTGSVTEAAKVAGVNRKTVHAWLKQPAFKLALKEAEAEALDNLSRELVSLSSEATATLRGVMGDDSAGLGHKLRAADITLANLLKIRELAGLEDRVTRLEEQLNNEQS